MYLGVWRGRCECAAGPVAGPSVAVQSGVWRWRQEGERGRAGCSWVVAMAAQGRAEWAGQCAPLHCRHGRHARFHFIAALLHQPQHVWLHTMD